MSRRKLRKQLNNSILSIDLRSIPEGWDMGTWNKVLHTKGWAMWDSNLGGEAPKILTTTTRIKALKFKDLNKLNKNNLVIG